MKILIIEDDREIAEFISKGLAENNYDATLSFTGGEGLRLAKENKYDVMVIDRMLPEIGGLEIIKEIRANNNNVPTLILSALGDTDDRVAGLRAGGDDYLVKPFAFAELLARIDALARRSNASKNIATELSAHGLTLDLLKRRAIKDEEEMELKGKEFNLLEYLLRNKGQVITRTMILENVWHYHFDPQTNIIDVHISRLRHKLGKVAGQPFIKTVRGAGYMIKADE